MRQWALTAPCRCNKPQQRAGGTGRGDADTGTGGPDAWTTADPGRNRASTTPCSSSPETYATAAARGGHSRSMAAQGTRNGPATAQPRHHPPQQMPMLSVPGECHSTTLATSRGAHSSTGAGSTRPGRPRAAGPPSETHPSTRTASTSNHTACHPHQQTAAPRHGKAAAAQQLREAR